MAEEAEFKEEVVGTYNLDQVDEELEKAKTFVTFKDGEKKTLKIHKEPIEQVKVNYGEGDVLRWRIHVTDINTGTEKSWTMGPRLFGQIKDYMQMEIDTMTFLRKGSGMETRYAIVPVVEKSNE